MASVIAGPIVNPANGHQYFLQPNTWTNAESEAVAMGGHCYLMMAENNWVWETFAPIQEVALIGLSDAAQKACLSG